MGHHRFRNKHQRAGENPIESSFSLFIRAFGIWPCLHVPCVIGVIWDARSYHFQVTVALSLTGKVPGRELTADHLICILAAIIGVLTKRQPEGTLLAKAGDGKLVMDPFALSERLLEGSRLDVKRRP